MGTPLLSTLTERIVYNIIMCLAGASFACMRLYVRYMHNRNKTTRRTKIFILGDAFLVAATVLVISIASVDIFQVSKETDFKNQMKEFQMMMAANGGKPPSAPPGVMRRAGPMEMPPFVSEFLILTLKVSMKDLEDSMSSLVPKANKCPHTHRQRPFTGSFNRLFLVSSNTLSFVTSGTLRKTSTWLHG